MSATVMMERIAKRSPRSLARMAGVFQALENITATFGQVIVLGWLVVTGNAAATATNILWHQGLFWLGFASSLIGVVCHIAWALLLYDLLKPVNRRVSLFALSVMLVGCTIQALTIVLFVAPMVILNAGNSLSALTAEQSQALAYMFVRLNGYAFNTYLVFFGLWCIMIGFLIFRSTFMPRVLGVLLAISGLGWVTYLVPPAAIRLFFPYIAGASAIGEIPLLLWLLIVGANNERWKEQAGELN
ncbi:MAG: DUF4386 domain-containing protein [Candidatus Kryptoniota bacterium]